MAEITLNSQDIRQAGARSSGSGIFMDLVSGYAEPAEQRGVDTVIPGLAGRVARNRVKDTRRIVLEGYVVGTSASDWRSKTDTLMGACGQLTPVNLVLADSYLGVGSTKTIAVRVVNIVAGPITASRFQTWSIELESVAPDWT